MTGIYNSVVDVVQKIARGTRITPAGTAIPNLFVVYRGSDLIDIITRTELVDGRNGLLKGYRHAKSFT